MCSGDIFQVRFNVLGEEGHKSFDHPLPACKIPRMGDTIRMEKYIQTSQSPSFESAYKESKFKVVGVTWVYYCREGEECRRLTPRVEVTLESVNA